MKSYLIFSFFALMLIVSACSSKEANENELVANPVIPVDSQEESITTTAATTPENIDPEITTATTTQVYKDTEKQISVNFFDGYKKYNDNIIFFGPLGRVVESIPGDNRQVHIYQLETVGYKSAKDILKDYEITAVTIIKPVIEKIGNFEVVKYAEGGFCETRTLEVVGVKYNYLFSSNGCRKSREVDFKYLADTIKQLEILK